MSWCDTIKIEGKQSIGAITPLELLGFCLKHNVERINSLYPLYEVQDELGTCEPDFVDVETALEMQKEGKTIRPANLWAIDCD